MTEKMIIAVVGATGSQGGGLVRAILADPQGPFTVRALTRNADSGKARELASQGIEVVEPTLTTRRAFARLSTAPTALLWSRTSGRSGRRSRRRRGRAPRWSSHRPPRRRGLRRTRACGTWCGPPSRTPGRTSSDSASTSQPSSTATRRFRISTRRARRTHSSPSSECRPPSCRRPSSTSHSSLAGKALTVPRTASWSCPTRWPETRWCSSRPTTSERPRSVSSVAVMTSSARR